MSERLAQVLSRHRPPVPRHGWQQRGQLGKYLLMRRLTASPVEECWGALASGSDFSTPVFLRVSSWPLSADSMIHFPRRMRVSAPDLEEVYELGRTGERAFLASQFVAGASLARLDARLPWPLALALVVLGRSALAKLHAQGFVHGALTPARVRLGLGGAPLVVCAHTRVASHEPPHRSSEATPAAVRADLASLSVFVLAAAGMRITAEAQRLLASRDEQSLALLDDHLVSQAPAPFDGLLAGALRDSPSVDADIIALLDAPESTALWHAVERAAAEELS